MNASKFSICMISGFTAMLTLMVDIPTTSAQEEPDPYELINPEATAALLVRETLGLDARTLAALDVSPQAHFAIAYGALTYGKNNLQAIEPLAYQSHAARSECANPKAKERRPEVVAGVVNAHSAIRQRTANGFEIWKQLLTPEARLALTHVQANNGLDPLLQLLPLTNEQREQIWALTLDRDAVVRNPYQCHITSRVLKAQETFNNKAWGILTTKQQDSLAHYRTRVGVNMMQALQNELDAMDFASQQANAAPLFDNQRFVYSQVTRTLPVIIHYIQRSFVAAQPLDSRQAERKLKNIEQTSIQISMITQP